MTTDTIDELDTAVQNPEDLTELPCTRCGANPTEYADLLGHDRRGHLANHMLDKAGFVRVSEIALATDAELRLVRNMGDTVLARIRERIPQGSIPLDRYTPTVLIRRLPAGLHVEPWMLVEQDKAAALWCLTAFALDDERVWPHVLPRSIAFKSMRGPWRDDERVLLRAARSVYAVGGSVDLSAAAQYLNEGQWAVLVEAMRIRRDGSRSNP